MRATASAVVLALMATPAPAAGPLEPEANAGYRWRIAVRAASHPAVSAELRDRVGREAAAAAQAVLGNAGTAEVIDLNGPAERLDPLCRAVLAKGFAALDANPDLSPDPARVLTGVKTHVLAIDYRDGVFHLEARQHDGSSGIASPLVRRQADRNPDMLPRLAAMLIEPDFGPVGTVRVDPADYDKVTVTLRGHAAGGTERWVKVGDVFAVSVVRDTTPPVDPKKKPAGPPATVRTGTPFAFTLLKAIGPAQDGTVPCAVLTRFQKEYAFGAEIYRKRAVGVRCVKLPTVEGPVNLRLINGDGKPHARGSQLKVTGTDLDFATRPQADDEFKLRNGVYAAPRKLSGVACVFVSIGEDAPQRFPVAIVNAEPVTLKFELKPQDEARAEFARRCTDLRGRIADVSTAQYALYDALNRLIAARRNKDAASEVEAGVPRIVAAHKALLEELGQIKGEPGAADEGAGRVLADCERQLAVVKDGLARLDKTVALLKEKAAESNQPEHLEKEFRAKALADQIIEQVARGDVPEALETYEQLIPLIPDEAERQRVKDAREKLLAEWTPKDEDHRKARDVLRAWQNARQIDEFKPAIGKLRDAANTMLAKKDKLGLRRMLNTFEPAYANLQKLVNALDTDTEDGAKAAKEIQTIVEQARFAAETAREHLQKLVGEAKK